MGWRWGVFYQNISWYLGLDRADGQRYFQWPLTQTWLIWIVVGFSYLAWQPLALWETQMFVFSPHEGGLIVGTLYRVLAGKLKMVAGFKWVIVGLNWSFLVIRCLISLSTRWWGLCHVGHVPLMFCWSGNNTYSPNTNDNPGVPNPAPVGPLSCTV